MSVNVNGVEDMSNTTRIDGAVNTYGWLPYLIAYVPPADAIQTVNIATNSFNAEQGVAGGASINVIIKSGTSQFHGSAWEYNQLFNTNARAYANTPQVQPRVPKNIFNQFGFSIGGPVYIPKILTGKDKLFFFQDFERTTRRQLITGQQTVPTTAMLGGDFSAVASGLAGNCEHDPLRSSARRSSAPVFYRCGSRPTFLSEYGCNCIPASRQSHAAQTDAGPPQADHRYRRNSICSSPRRPACQRLQRQRHPRLQPQHIRLQGDLQPQRPHQHLRPLQRRTVHCHRSAGARSRPAAAPLTAASPEQPQGRIQNVGLGFSHVITSHMVIDADFGYTRQVTGANL